MGVSVCGGNTIVFSATHYVTACIIAPKRRAISLEE